MGNPHEIPIKNTWNWLDGAVFDLASPWTQRFAQDARSAVRTARRRRARSVWSFRGRKKGQSSRVPVAQGDLFPFFLFGYKLYQVMSIKESPVLSLESSYFQYLPYKVVSCSYVCWLRSHRTMVPDSKTIGNLLN